MNLKGKVKSLIDTSNYVLSNGNSSFITNISFDENGSMLSKEIISKDYGKVTFKRAFFYKYDSLRRKIQEQKFINGTLRDNIFFNYNKEGDILTINNSEFNSIDSFIYNKEKNSVEIWNKTKNLEPYIDYIKYYSANGNLIKEERYGINNDTLFTQIFRYNAEGLLIEKYYVNPNGDYGTRVLYDRDTLGREIRIRHFEEFDKELMKEFTYKYNKYDNMIASTEKSAYYDIDAKHRVEYKYDEFGNYIEGRKYESGKMWILAKRKIFYY
ncbi:MAG: hypothetical protein R2792_18685 [Saprospiraceae bacterium]